MQNPLMTTFRAYEAISQRGKGGVYRALDLTVRPARLCLLKEGRRHGETDFFDRDGRWRVRHEHQVLVSLRRAGIDVPNVYDSFEIDGHYYLVTEFIEGETWGDAISPDEPKTEMVVVRAWPAATRSDRTLAAIGELFAALHAASRGFRPASPIWREYEVPMKEDEIVCQGDAGPWNVVSRDGMPAGLIDWDGARPARPIDDLASIAWHFVPLGTDDLITTCGFDRSFDPGRRLRILCDAYGLEDRVSILPALSRVKQLAPMVLRYWQPLRTGAAANWLRATVADLDWLDRATPGLLGSLT